MRAGQLAAVVGLAVVGFALGHVAATNKAATTTTVTASKAAAAAAPRPAVHAVDVGLVVPALVVRHGHRSEAANLANQQRDVTGPDSPSATGPTKSLSSSSRTQQQQTTTTTSTTTKPSHQKIKPLIPDPFSGHDTAGGSSTGDSGAP